jgi:hypothetical protein
MSAILNADQALVLSFRSLRAVLRVYQARINMLSSIGLRFSGAELWL